MAREMITDVDTITGQKITIGWFNWDTLVEQVEESTDWNGQNRIGRTSGLQTSTQLLLRTPGGRWILYTDRRSEFNGPLDIAYVTDEQARQWMLTNEREDVHEKYFGPLTDESPNLEYLGRRRQDAVEDFKRAVAEQAPALLAAKQVTEDQIAQWGGVSRNTVRGWLGK